MGADSLQQAQQHAATGHGSSSRISAGGSSVAADGCVWSLNVGSAVAIVFVNKVLMSSQGGHGFSFAVTLSAIHFLTSAGCIVAAQAAGLAEQAKRMPWKATLWFSLVGVVSIGSLNLSLLVNPVGLYQVAKLLVIPFVCGVEAVWMRRRFSNGTLLAIATVMAGVGVVTVNDLDSGATQLLGVMLAAVGVVASGSHQVLCGSLQRAYKLQSHQLLAASAMVQGALLLLLGPWVDSWVSGRWVGGYTLTVPSMSALLLSCMFSVGVNVSHFMCLGRFSAATFQVLGHTKTVLVLLISWLALGEAMSARKAAGMAVAVAGMVGYGYCVSASSSNKISIISSSTTSSKSCKPVGAAGVSVELELGCQQRDDSSRDAADADADAAPATAAVAAAGVAPRGTGESLPLLRDVSWQHAGWAGESVVVVTVQQSEVSSGHGSCSSRGIQWRA